MSYVDFGLGNGFLESLKAPHVAQTESEASIELLMTYYHSVDQDNEYIHTSEYCIHTIFYHGVGVVGGREVAGGF